MTPVRLPTAALADGPAHLTAGLSPATLFPGGDS